MYSVVTWEIDSGPADPTTIESETRSALGDRQSYDIYGDVRIVRVASTTDFLLMHEALARIAEHHSGQFRYASWALRSGAPMRTSVALDTALAREVIVG